MGNENLLVFSGNANRPLAQAVCAELGVPMGKALVGRFSDGEVQVEIEENVRRPGRVRDAADLRADRRELHGTAGA